MGQTQSLRDKLPSEGPSVASERQPVLGNRIGNIAAGATIRGYTAYSKDLNGLRPTDKQVEIADRKKLKADFAAFAVRSANNGSLYLGNSYIDEHGGTMDVVAGPHTLQSSEEIEGVIRKFSRRLGKGKSHEAFIREELHELYGHGGLSRPMSGQGNARLSLILNARIPGYDNNTYHVIEAGQGNPASLRSLDVPESIALWYALQAGGYNFDDDLAFEQTRVQHSDLEPILLEGKPYVPTSCVSNGGRSDLYLSSA